MVGKDIISVNQFNRESLEAIYQISLIMEKKSREKEELDILKDKIMASLFFEPSTRTRFSFESAIHRLGGKVIATTDAIYSSMAKGETLKDTIKTIEKYADIIVIRHPQKGSAKIAARCTKIPVINAGDGPGEHPTQALLDFYTIKKEKRRVSGLKISMVGDLKYGRTVHSLVKLLSNYENLEFCFISPKELKMPKEYLEIL
ncbi:MAG: aspartate carbamoyltransferase, partial [Candidatus Aenigmarchaeota archaeon]|nr:aspartate carbamoyltransferase [Candidatus Aenigmarchaeota archaeon]